jgi:hypothetical protein
MDLSDADLSGVSRQDSVIGDCNFRGANLSNADFSRTHFRTCTFDESDWNGMIVTDAYFNGGSFKKVRNASASKGLQTATADGFVTRFETSVPRWSDYFDWERVKIVGRLPIFGASSAALVGLPLFFYALDNYNDHVAAWRSALELSANDAPAAGNQFLQHLAERLPMLQVPSLSLLSLASALILFLASLLYASFCPAIVKEFSRNVWNVQFQRSMLLYLAQAWRFPAIRLTCGILYAVGGFMAAWVIASKLWTLFLYLCRHSTLG